LEPGEGVWHIPPKSKVVIAKIQLYSKLKHAIPHIFSVEVNIEFLQFPVLSSKNVFLKIMS